MYRILNRERQVTGININSQGFPRITLALSKCQSHYAMARLISIFSVKYKLQFIVEQLVTTV